MTCWASWIQIGDPTPRSDLSHAALAAKCETAEMRVTVLHVRARDPPKARYFPTRWALNAAADALAKAERTGGDFTVGTMTTSTIGMILVHRPGAERKAGPSPCSRRSIRCGLATGVLMGALLGGGDEANYRRYRIADSVAPAIRAPSTHWPEALPHNVM
jgi:hypothetical protein